MAPGAVTARYASQNDSGAWLASNDAPDNLPYTYRLSNPCIVNDQNTGACQGTDFRDCVAPPGRAVQDLVIEERRLVLADGRTIDNFAVPPGTAPGTQVGPWISVARACIDVTALNPPPSPGEVFRYFKELPLPKLTTKQQPPGNALSGLPVIFFTDSPTTQDFTVNIRGFTVTIAARATGFTWHTGDGTDLTSSGPGAAYPNQTVTHDYRSGSYTASLTTTWGATFRVNGGASAAVPGTTTTDGPAVTFTVLQAHAVLTNPYD
ncbi:MAG: hypothetical protein JWP40_2460 [Blastococcus sp.]|nr:hypothetical protein [Blastococcus sp.]